jgi:3-oxoacyl-[acyl-carrier-protein] synthase III
MTQTTSTVHADIDADQDRARERPSRRPLSGCSTGAASRGPLVRHVGIRGVGSHLPAAVLTNAALAQWVETSDDWIRTRTGITERRVAAAHETTSHLATVAARRALEHAQVAPADLDLVIVATVTPDSPFPAVAALVQEAIGARRAAAFDLAAACSGFTYALATGTQYIAGGLYERVLIVGADCFSRLVDWSDRDTCVLFGDGAGAVVLEPVPEGMGCLAFDLGADGSGASHLRVEPRATGPLVEAGMVCRPPAIRMTGSEVFKFAVRTIEGSTRRALQRAELTIEDLDLLIAHQANARILDAAAERLALPPEKVFRNVEKYGNTSAASIPIALGEALAKGEIRRGDLVALCGFGAGLSWASCVLRWSQ